ATAIHHFKRGWAGFAAGAFLGTWTVLGCTFAGAITRGAGTGVGFLRPGTATGAGAAAWVTIAGRPTDPIGAVRSTSMTGVGAADFALHDSRSSARSAPL